MKYSWIDAYLLEKPGMTKDYKEEWGWNRYLLEGKMVAAICKNKEKQDIITLKCEPMLADELRSQYEEVMHGYYMNKVHWISVRLEGNLDDELLKGMMDHSYDLIFKKFSQKKQLEIKNG